MFRSTAEDASLDSVNRNGMRCVTLRSVVYHRKLIEPVDLRLQHELVAEVALRGQLWVSLVVVDKRLASPLYIKCRKAVSLEV